jgi:hypothetical protein
MSDDKPTALEDVRKGLGLLFRAARTAAEKLPKGGVEEVVVTSAREVGRALENVASAIEREVFGKRGQPPQQPTRGPAEPPRTGATDETKPGEPKPPDGG